ncbi:MAG: YceI family protein [Phycisphaerales bacterium]
MSVHPLTVLVPSVLVAGSLALLPAMASPTADAPAAIAAATVAAPQAATSTAAMTYDIDNVHSCALFRVQHLGAGQFFGRFNRFEGQFTFSESNGPIFDVKIPIDSVDTDNDRLDGHLRSPDFFNAVEHPAMSFKNISATKSGERMWDVTGEITILGVTKTVPVKVEWTGTKDVGRGVRTGLEAIFTIKRSDFGMMYGVENGMLGDETRIIVSIEGTPAT